MGTRVVACVMAALSFTTPQVLSAEDSLAAARELYASAAYDDALKMLEGLAARATGEDRDTTQLYRVMCLVALGRKADAERAIDSLVAANPRFRPATDDIAPRVLTAFRDARRRMLPAMIQRAYAASKAAFDRQDFNEASRGFKDMLGALNDPDLGPAGGESPLSDLRILASGFYDLSAKAATPPPLPTGPAPQPPAAIIAPKVDTTRIYTSDDPRVVAPVTVRQEMPQFRGTITVAQRGQIEIVINEAGQVESAQMRVPLATPAHNDFALSTARAWRYRPATIDGVAVKFRKLITVNLATE